MVHRSRCSNGTASSAATSPWPRSGTICGLYRRDTPGEYAPVTGGLAQRFASELLARGAGLGPYPFKDTAVFLYVPWAAKRLADHLLTESDDTARVTPLLHALVADVVVDESSSAIRGVVVASKQGPKVVAAKVVIDATGDADVAAAAGVPCVTSDVRQFGSMQFVIQHADTDALLQHGAAALGPADRGARRPPHA